MEDTLRIDKQDYGRPRVKDNPLLEDLDLAHVIVISGSNRVGVIT